MNRRVLAGILTLTLAGWLAACGGEEAADSPQGDATVAAGTADLSTLTAQRWLDDFRIGSAASPEGMVTDRADRFAPGQPIHVSMAVGDAPPASAVKVVWIGPGETTIGDEMKTVIGGQKTMQFQAPDTALWAPGEYRAEAWVGDERVESLEFRIEGETPPATQS